MEPERWEKHENESGNNGYSEKICRRCGIQCSRLPRVAGAYFKFRCSNTNSIHFEVTGNGTDAGGNGTG